MIFYKKKPLVYSKCKNRMLMRYYNGRPPILIIDLLIIDPLSKSLYLFYHYRHYNQHNLLQCLPRVCSLFGQRKNVPDIFYMYSLSFLNILQKSTFYPPNFFVTTTVRKILTSELVEHANRLKLVVCYRY